MGEDCFDVAAMTTEPLPTVRTTDPLPKPSAQPSAQPRLITVTVIVDAVDTEAVRYALREIAADLPAQLLPGDELIGGGYSANYLVRWTAAGAPVGLAGAL